MNKIEKLIREKCPNGVEHRKLKDIGETFTGLSGKGKDDFSNGNVKYITYTNIYNNPAVKLNLDDMVFIKDGEKQNTLKYGDILVTGSSENIEDSGMISVVCEEPRENIYLNSFCFGFRLNDDYSKRVLPGFSKHFFRSADFRSQILSCSFGVTRYNLNKKMFLELTIPIPPIDVQKEIVQILDKFVELEAELEVELEAELEARQSQYEFWRRKLLNKETGRKIRKLREICVFENGKGHEQLVEDDGKYLLVTSKAISSNLNKVRKTNLQLLPLYKDDIALVMSDLPNGKALSKCLFIELDNKYTLNQRVCRIKTNSSEIIPKYLYYFLDRNKQLLKHDNGVDQTNLKKADILNIDVLIPTINEQKYIVLILDKFDKLVNDISVGLAAEIEARRKQYEYYRNKLLSFEEVSCE